MPEKTPPRFVNLNTHKVFIQDPDGNNIVVFPFSEAHLKRTDAKYVVEGDYYSRYSGTSAGPLFPFPRNAGPTTITSPEADAVPTVTPTPDAAVDDANSEATGPAVIEFPPAIEKQIQNASSVQTLTQAEQDQFRTMLEHRVRDPQFTPEATDDNAPVIAAFASVVPYLNDQPQDTKPQKTVRGGKFGFKPAKK